MMNYKQKYIPYIPWFCLVRLVCVWYMSVYLLICICAHVCAIACMGLCVWKPEVNIVCLPPTLTTLLFEAGSYWTGHLAIWLNQLPSDLQGSSCLHFTAWGYRHTPLYTAFTRMLGIWNRSSCLHGSTFGQCIVLVRPFIAVTKRLRRSTKGSKCERF